MYDYNEIRKHFPILGREVHGHPLVYLDNAATMQKPLCVLDAMRDEYLNANANVHRGVHYLSQQATDLHEAARERVRQFINARKIEEIVFTRGTTEAINLVAATFGREEREESEGVPNCPESDLSPAVCCIFPSYALWLPERQQQYSRRSRDHPAGRIQPDFLQPAPGDMEVYRRRQKAGSTDPGRGDPGRESAALSECERRAGRMRLDERRGALR